MSVFNKAAENAVEAVSGMTSIAAFDAAAVKPIAVPQLRKSLTSSFGYDSPAPYLGL